MPQFLWEDGSSSVQRGVQFKEVNCFNLPENSTNILRFLGNAKVAQTHWIAGEERSRGCMETAPGKCPFKWKGKHAYARPTWFAPAQIGTERFEKGETTFSEAFKEKSRGKGLKTKLEWEDCVLAIPKHFFQQLPEGELRGWILEVFRLPKFDKNGKALSKRSIRVQKKSQGPDFPDQPFDVMPVMERVWGLDPNVVQGFQDSQVEEVTESVAMTEMEMMKEQIRLLTAKFDQFLNAQSPQSNGNGHTKSHSQTRPAAEGGAT